MKSDFKVIYSGFDEDFHFGVIDKLYTDHHWKPVYLVGNPKNEKKIREKYSDATFHCDFDACRGIIPKDLKGITLEPLDSQILEKLSFDRFIAIKMMDRMDPGGSFNFDERLELFNNLASYWLTVLREYNPNFVVFHLTPHLIYDYILYSVLKIENIRSIILNYTSVNDLIYACNRFEESTPIKRTYDELMRNNNIKADLSKSILDYLKRIRGIYSEATPFYVKSNISKENKTNRKKSLKWIISSLKATLLSVRDYNKPFRQNYLKRINKPISDSAWTVIEYKKYKKNANKYKLKLRNYYDNKSVQPDLDKNFIYAPLQYQPEKTTSPEAGIFVDQFLMIDILSKSIPDNYSIYVKEHPSQFFETWHGERSSKNQAFYDKLIALPNVKLVCLNTPSFELIDNSVACCTTTGTSGWESILRGKPVLLFGHPWYAGCEGIFNISTIDNCREAIINITSGYKVDDENLKLFFIAMKKTCAKGFIYGRMKEITDIPIEENINGVVKIILNSGVNSQYNV
ncbi:MAG: hypothetical protein GY714_15720 [Desulfobacterales bacterium]|nr:hypothetical protein [Desulfobacterales bacterium]